MFYFVKEWKIHANSAQITFQPMWYIFRFQCRCRTCPSQRVLIQHNYQPLAADRTYHACALIRQTYFSHCHEFDRMFIPIRHLYLPHSTFFIRLPIQKYIWVYSNENFLSNKSCVSMVLYLLVSAICIPKHIRACCIISHSKFRQLERNFFLSMMNK